MGVAVLSRRLCCRLAQNTSFRRPRSQKIKAFGSFFHRRTPCFRWRVRWIALFGRRTVCVSIDITVAHCQDVVLACPLNGRFGRAPRECRIKRMPALHRVYLLTALLLAALPGVAYAQGAEHDPFAPARPPPARPTPRRPPPVVSPQAPRPAPATATPQSPKSGFFDDVRRTFQNDIPQFFQQDIPRAFGAGQKPPPQSESKPAKPN